MKTLGLSLLLIISTVTMAATPVGPMSYQGRLLDNNGIPVTGNYDFKVEVYDDETTGTLQYAEDHIKVLVEDGVYSLKVGTQTPITGSWDIDLWQGNLNSLFLDLNVRVYGGGAYEALTPRHELTSAPHAFTATLALAAEKLGTKTATEYDNILEGICESSKGRWLSKAEKCLGAESDFSVAAVGGSVVNYSTLHNSTDFSDLDLSGADISGIEFSSSNLSNTQFVGTTYNSQLINSADLNGSHWDGSTDVNTGSTAVFSGSTYLSNAFIKNMNLSKWNISNLSLNNFSAAYLSACPISTPAQWKCRIQHSPSTGNYFLVGPYVNLSSSSALAITKSDGRKHLDFHRSALWATGIYLNNADMTGVVVTQQIYFTGILGIDFSNSKFVDAYFYALAVPQYGTRSIDFSYSEWIDSRIYLRKDDPSDYLDFTGAKFSYSFLQLPMINLTAQYVFLGFNGAIFENTTITGAGGSSLPMTDVLFNNVILDVDADRLELIDCKIYGDFAVDNVHSTGGNSRLETSDIKQARFTGRFDDWVFNENTFYHAQLDGRFADSNWTTNELNRTIMGNDFYNATLSNQGNSITGGIRWKGTCPEDDMASSEGNEANGNYCSITW